MNENIHPIAKLGDFQEVLWINKSDLQFVGKERAPEVRCVRVDFNHKTIDQPVELESHFKFNPWEEITSDQDRNYALAKLRATFKPEGIEIKLAKVLAAEAIV